jgi:hypothetical protein
MMMLPDGYIKRKTSTIPFGYAESDLEVVEEMLNNQEISLQIASDWLGYKVGRTMSKAGLKKHMDKKYGKTRQTFA